MHAHTHSCHAPNLQNYFLDSVGDAIHLNPKELTDYILRCFTLIFHDGKENSSAVLQGEKLSFYSLQCDWLNSFSLRLPDDLDLSCQLHCVHHCLFHCSRYMSAWAAIQSGEMSVWWRFITKKKKKTCRDTQILSLLIVIFGSTVSV